MAWVVHLLVAKIVLKAMNLPSSVTWVELFAYTGYAFVPVCLAIIGGQAFGRLGYYSLWLYGSLAMAIFLVRTMKRVIFQEARNYSECLMLTLHIDGGRLTGAWLRAGFSGPEFVRRVLFMLHIAWLAAMHVLLSLQCCRIYSSTSRTLATLEPSAAVNFSTTSAQSVSCIYATFNGK